MLFRLGKGLVPVQAELALALVAQEHVLTDGQLRNQCQFLMDNDNADFLTVPDGLEVALLTVVYDLPRVGAIGICTAEYVHQRGLTGAVFANQRVDLSPRNFQIDMVQGFDARKFLCDVFHHQDIVSQTDVLLS